MVSRVEPGGRNPAERAPAADNDLKQRGEIVSVRVAAGEADNGEGILISHRDTTALGFAVGCVGAVGARPTREVADP